VLEILKIRSEILRLFHANATVRAPTCTMPSVGKAANRRIDGAPEPTKLVAARREGQHPDRFGTCRRPAGSRKRSPRDLMNARRRGTRRPHHAWLDEQDMPTYLEASGAGTRDLHGLTGRCHHYLRHMRPLPGRQPRGRAPGHGRENTDRRPGTRSRTGVRPRAAQA
jgi:hypothetical protein